LYAQVKKGIVLDSESVIEQLREFFLLGNSFENIVDARNFISGSSVSGDNLSWSRKEIDELLEKSLVRAARDLVHSSADPFIAYDQLVELYGRQPNLHTRSSASIRQQAYSTPLPIAYLASILAKITPETTVFEPSAGNGALLVTANPQLVIANELNPDRAAELRRKGYQVSEFDAVQYRPDKPVDVVIMNPPFGSVTDETNRKQRWLVNGGSATKPYSTTQIDHAIALNALQSMADNGRAVLILGAPLTNKTGNQVGSSETYNSISNRAFYKSLYDNYQVVDHFCIAGDLYARQGTTFPIDLVVIAGRGQSRRKLPAAELPVVYRSFLDLEEKIYEHFIRDGLEPGNRRLNVNPTDDREGDRTNSQLINLSGTSLQEIAGDDFQGEVNGNREFSPDLARDTTARGQYTRGLGRHPDQFQQPAPGDLELSGALEFSPRANPGDPSNAGDARTDNRGGMARSDESTLPGERPMIDSSETEKVTQVAYQPRSHGRSVGSLVPTNMAVATATALQNLENKVGPIDPFVANRLEIEDLEILYQRFSAEQIDALGLAISNLEKNEGFIIGDQTGIGKGRFVAGIIEYTRRQGLIPIFVSQDPKLYGDMSRDLRDIGVTDINPLMTNSGLSIPLPDGRVWRTGSAKSHKLLLERFIADRNIGNYDAVFTTYSQLQSVKKADTHRRELLIQIAPRAVLICDESHNAGGTYKEWKDFGPLDRADFIRGLVQRSAGVVFSSATYAKNPYVMTLYSSKTGIRYGADNPEELVNAIQKGGIPLQQILASQLVEAGQYLRRERSYQGIEFDARVVPVNTSLAEKMATVMRQVMAFDEAKKTGLKALNEDLKSEAKRIGKDNAVGEIGARSTNFTSLMHNYVGQSLLAQKAEATAQRAIESLKAGEKPVVVVSNTMGSAIGDYAESHQLKIGDPLQLTMGDLLERYLVRSREVMIQDYTNQSKRELLTNEQLGEEAVTIYQNTLELIRATDWRPIPVSPIDWIRYKLEEAGYSVGEITGRQQRVSYSGGLPTYEQRGSAELGPAASMTNVNNFNNGSLDCLVINRSGSTGISLHASDGFLDKQPRRMIITQAEPNIDTFVQTLGRIHRTGQVELPRFELLMADLPAETRPAAILLKKMASLNANTTAARQSGIQLGEGVTDFMNEYGDQVAVELMVAHPSLNRELGNPIIGAGGWNVEATDINPEGAIARVTGRIPLLPIARQEWVYNRISEAYNERLEHEKALGTNVLEAQTLDLQAKTLGRLEVKPAMRGIDSPFAGPVYAEIVNAKTPRVPRTTLGVINKVRGELGLPNVDDPSDHSALEATRLAKEMATSQVTLLTQRVEELKKRYTTPNRNNGTQLNNPPKLIHQINQQFTQVRSVLQQFPIGTAVKFYENKKDAPFAYGVITGIEQRFLEGTNQNPTHPRNWQLCLEVANATVELKIPLSRININGENGINLYQQERAGFGDCTVYELFDKQQKTHEQRTIFTGNPLRAYKEFPGQFINFTNSKGDVRQGMIMSRGFDLKEQLEKQPIKLNGVTDCQRFFNQTNGYTSLKTGDEVLNIQPKRPSGGVYLQTPLNKSKGGRYYLDEELLTAAGDQFESVGNKMVMRVASDRVDAVLAYLYANNLPLFAFERQEVAREIMGLPLPNFEDLDAILAELPPHVEELDSTEQLLVLAGLESALALDIQEQPTDLKVVTIEQEIESRNAQVLAEQRSLEHELEIEFTTWDSSVCEAFQTRTSQEGQSIGECLLSEVYALRHQSEEVLTIEEAMGKLYETYGANASSTIAPQPIISEKVEVTELQGYSPSLGNMRSWVADARILAHSPSYLERIKQISIEMLADTSQAILPIGDRDPNFRNPHFALSEAAQLHRLNDAQKSSEVRSPTREQLLNWYKFKYENGASIEALTQIQRLGVQQITGTAEEKKHPKDRDPQFQNTNFVLSYPLYHEMVKDLKNQSIQVQPDLSKSKKYKTVS
jgi:hypothetical protein